MDKEGKYSELAIHLMQLKYTSFV